jgi:putative phosphonate metabolism protein
VSEARYAVYFVPPADSVLYQLGSSVLGYDCRSGADVPHPPKAGLPPDWADLTQAPRRYGFHATLVAPFCLSSEFDEPALVRAFAMFGDRDRDIATIEPAVRTLGRFIAVVPRDRNAALDRLAVDCVTYFDRFRAPLSAADHARRLTPGLSERERQNLDRWGYPYVFADFRFHMTLTGPVGPDRRPVISDLLARLLARTCGNQAVRIDRIALLRQDHEDQRFRVLREAGLRHRPMAASLAPTGS